MIYSYSHLHLSFFSSSQHIFSDPLSLSFFHSLSSHLSLHLCFSLSVLLSLSLSLSLSVILSFSLSLCPFLLSIPSILISSFILLFPLYSSPSRSLRKRLWSGRIISVISYFNLQKMLTSVEDHFFDL